MDALLRSTSVTLRTLDAEGVADFLVTGLARTCAPPGAGPETPNVLSPCELLEDLLLLPNSPFTYPSSEVEVVRELVTFATTLEHKHPSSFSTPQYSVQGQPLTAAALGRIDMLLTAALQRMVAQMEEWAGAAPAEPTPQQQLQQQVKQGAPEEQQQQGQVEVATPAAAGAQRAVEEVRGLGLSLLSITQEGLTLASRTSHSLYDSRIEATQLVLAGGGSLRPPQPLRSRAPPSAEVEAVLAAMLEKGAPLEAALQQCTPKKGMRKEQQQQAPSSSAGLANSRPKRPRTLSLVQKEAVESQTLQEITSANGKRQQLTPEQKQAAVDTALAAAVATAAAGGQTDPNLVLSQDTVAWVARMLSRRAQGTGCVLLQCSGAGLIQVAAEEPGAQVYPLRAEQLASMSANLQPFTAWALGNLPLRLEGGSGAQGAGGTRGSAIVVQQQAVLVFCVWNDFLVSPITCYEVSDWVARRSWS